MLNFLKSIFNSDQTAEARLEDLCRKVKKNDEERNQALGAFISSVVMPVVGRHAQTLSEKRHRLAFRDEYGFEDKAAWLNEVRRFYARAIEAQLIHALTDYKTLNDAGVNFLSLNGYFSKPKGKSELRTLVVNVIDEAIATAPQPKKPSVEEPESGHGFEILCENLFRSNGWRVHRTQMSGDQGADLVATKQKRKLVVQCKFWSRPIGNKAVQEVIAAMTYYEANEAAVVSNQPFTPSAKRLANSADISLLHPDDISEI